MKQTALLQDIPIRRKLTLIAALPVATSLFFVVLISMIYQWFQLRAELEKSTHGQASIVADDAASAMLFNNAKAAGHVLETLGTFEGIEFAMLQDRHGRIFALYTPAGQPAPHPHPAPPAEQHVFTATHLDVFHPLFIGGEQIGTIHVRASLGHVYRQMALGAAVVLASALGGLGLALMLVTYLHPAITGPMTKLVAFMDRVSSVKDYGLRAEFRGKDELGALAHGLNDMLAQIQMRDNALAKSREHLEHEVTQRTAELKAANILLGKELTERKVAELELQLVNEQLSILLESLPVAIYRRQAHDGFPVAYVTRNVINFSGYSSDDFIRKADFWIEHIHPGDAPGIPAAMERLLAEGVHECEYRWLKPDGSQRWILDSMRLVQPADRAPPYIVGIWQDITERKHAQENIRKQQELISQIVETIPMRVFWKDRDLRYLGCNTLFAKDAGLARPGELIGQTDLDMVWRDQAEMYRADDRLVMESDIPKLSYDEPQTTPQGNRIWVRTSKVPLRNERDETIGVLGVYEDITTYKQMELRLRESEERFRKAFQYSAIGMALVGLDGHWLKVNDALCQITGYPEQELLRMTFQDITHPDDFESDHVIAARLLGGEVDHYQMEKRYLHKDGHVVWIRLSVSLIRDAQEQPLHYVAQIDDITDDKLAEETLRQANVELGLFRTLLDNTSDAIEVVDPETLQFLDVNASACRNLGYSREELLTLRVVDIDPTFDEAAKKNLDAQMQAAGTARYEGVHRRKDGSEFAVEVNIGAAKLDKLYGLSIVRDITERKQAEQRIRESEERYRGIFEHAYDIIYILNLDGTFRSLSPAIKRVAGWKAEEWIGKPFAPLIHADDLPGANAAFQKLLNGASISSLALRIAKKSGEYFDAELSAAPLSQESIMGIVRDVSERKQAEAQIRQLNEALESKVQERTIQLLEAQDELLRKEKLAVLGQVAGSVGHELRNPLGVMNNAVYYLQTVLSDADETTQEYLNIIKDEIASSERIVSDLLDSVRTKPPHPEAVGVATLIEQALRKCAIPPSVALKLDIPQTLSPLQVDAQQIHQVFRNLISNGVEAMPEGGTLEIRALEDRQAHTITISVRDSGTGIAPELLAKLFQPLVTTKARGIGLGLVVVKNLTTVNGGSVRMESETGRGSTFFVTLPSGGTSLRPQAGAGKQIDTGDPDENSRSGR